MIGNRLDNIFQTVQNRRGLQAWLSSVGPSCQVPVDPDGLHAHVPCPVDVEWVGTDQPDILLLGAQSHLIRQVLIHCGCRLELLDVVDGDNILKHGRMWR